MGKKYLITVILILTLGTITSNAQNYSLGGNINYAIENDNATGGVGFEGNFTFYTESIIAIRASVGRYASDTKIDKLSEGDYSLLWMEGTLLIQAKTINIQPYIGLGGGYYITGHELSSNVKNALSLLGLRGKEEIADMFSIHLRGGLNINVAPTVALNADIKYVFLKPEVKVEITNLYNYQTVSATEKVDLSTVVLGFGVTVRI